MQGTPWSSSSLRGAVQPSDQDPCRATLAELGSRRRRANLGVRACVQDTLGQTRVHGARCRSRARACAWQHWSSSGPQGMGTTSGSVQGNPGRGRVHRARCQPRARAQGNLGRARVRRARCNHRAMARACSPGGAPLEFVSVLQATVQECATCPERCGVHCRAAATPVACRHAVEVEGVRTEHAAGTVRGLRRPAQAVHVKPPAVVDGSSPYEAYWALQRTGPPSVPGPTAAAGPAPDASAAGTLGAFLAPRAR